MSTDGDRIPITYVTGPSEPMCLADQPGTYVEVLVAASPERVWALVIDLDTPARFSTEFRGARWAAGGPALGAEFVGRNRHEAIGEWEVSSFVDVFDDGAAFGWATVDPVNPGSRWRFDLAPACEGTRLRYSMSMGPGPSGITQAIRAMPEKEPRILQRRIAEHHANMRRTVEGIASLAEDSDPS
jgi:hypothetical protein